MKSVVLALLALSAFGADNRQTFHWRGLILPGKMIEIKGINGDVYAEMSDGTEVEVVANMVPGKSDPAAVKVEMLEHDKGVTVCAVYPSGSTQCAAGEAGQSATENNDVRVNFTVRVPKGVALVGRTVNGRVDADSLKSDVEAYTVNGGVRISTTGNAQARTVNGSIMASLLKSEWSKTPNFSTVNGGITVELPKCTSASLRAETLTGHIVANFPLMPPAKHAKSVRARLGTGGPALMLKTVNGVIQLRRVG